MLITNTDRVRAELESQIVAGALPPGTMLDEAELSRSFDVSRTPVREALLQLAAKGYVRIVPRGGIFVIQLSAGELAEMFETLAYAEGLCARLAAQRMSDGQLRKMVQLQKQGSVAVHNNDSAALAAYAHAFHECIYSSCGNRYLRDEILHIRKRTNPYRQQQQDVDPQWAAKSWQEHQDLLDALLERDAEAAAKAARGFVISRAQKFTDIAEMSPDHQFFDSRTRSAAQREAMDISRLFMPAQAIQ